MIIIRCWSVKFISQKDIKVAQCINKQVSENIIKKGCPVTALLTCLLNVRYLIEYSLRVISIRLLY